MPKKGADTKVRKIAREIVESVDDPDLEGMLYEVQSAAISLSVSTSELISLMKRRDPEYAAVIEAMEDTQDDQEPDEAESTDESDTADGGTQEESESAGESDGPEDKDEKD